MLMFIGFHETDASRKSIRDGVEIGGSGEDGGELEGEEREDDNGE